MQQTEPTPQTFAVQPAAERGSFDHGWLQTAHSFSFADYVDPKNLNWGALRVFNDDVIAPGKGFGIHPHRDMEILTYVLDGELEHRDSLGNTGVVRPGGVQYLSAGTGITHSEFNHSAEHPLRLVQMWVMPRRRNEAPRYGQVDFTRAERTNRWLTIASGRPGVAAPIAVHQDAVASVARLEQARLEARVEREHYAFLFIASGEVRMNGETTLGPGDAVRILGPMDLVLEGTGEAVLWDTPSFERSVAGYE